MTATLCADEFVRRLTMRSSQIAWLLGAGASAAAGVPTAEHMIAGFKAGLYASAHKIPRGVVDVDDPVWASRITRHFDRAHGFPAAGDPSEYQVAFERMYPDPRDRRTYIDQQVSKGRPSFGHRVMAALISSGRLPLVFTTNFDDLIEQAARAADELLAPSQRARLAVSALNSTDVAKRCLRESDWPLLVKLHGDFQSVALKNTEGELRAQDAVLRRVLSESTRRFGLAVVGYSGRDASILEVLSEALTEEDPFPAGLFWTARPGTPPLPAVVDLLTRAAARGVDAWLVESDTFDELFGEIEGQAALPPVLAQSVLDARPVARVVDVELPATAADRFPALRCNALVLESLPSAARAFRLGQAPEDLRGTLRGVRARADAVQTGPEILAFGADDDLRKALAIPPEAWRPQAVPVDVEGDPVAFGLVYQALTRALARSRPLRHEFRGAGHSLHLHDPATVDDDDWRRRLKEQLAPMHAVYGEDLFGTVPEQDRRYAEGVNLRLERRLGRWWLLFEPFTWVQRPTEPVRPDPVVPWLRQRWVFRRNKEWAAMVNAWARMLAPQDRTEVRAWRLDEGAGVDAVFTLGRVTAWSEPLQAGTR